jgi:hypothetical protein
LEIEELPSGLEKGNPGDSWQSLAILASENGIQG